MLDLKHGDLQHSNTKSPNNGSLQTEVLKAC